MQAYIDEAAGNVSMQAYIGEAAGKYTAQPANATILSRFSFAFPQLS
jgi:hypothetical protein